MKYRSKAPPEAMPFRRGKRPPPPTPRSVTIEWLSPTIWAALIAEGTDAHRLASGADFWLERFGHDVLLSYQKEADRDAVLAELNAKCGLYGFQPTRVFGKYLPTHAAERGAPTLLRGDEKLSLMAEATEMGVCYGLDFEGGYSAGLFIDQRANRARLRALKPGRVLNTFAYTCAFSVVAALVGAETVSIDLSRRSLTRGEDNFKRNGLDPEVGDHRFIADDVLAVLPRLARRGETFDAIILDPPTFSRNQSGAAFQVQRDFEKLVSLALEVAAKNAHLLLSVNHSAMRVADLEWTARSALKIAGRSGRFVPAPPQPDFPPGIGAKTVWLEVK